MPEMSELKPCPFCGHGAKIIPDIEKPDSGWLGVGCFQQIGDHDCPGFRLWVETVDRAVVSAVWNRRAPSPVVAEVVKEMREFRALYGEHFPFDPQASGFDAVLRDGAGKQQATCRILNRVLNDEWASRLERGE